MYTHVLWSSVMFCRCPGGDLPPLPNLVCSLCALPCLPVAFTSQPEDEFEDAPLTAADHDSQSFASSSVPAHQSRYRSSLCLDGQERVLLSRDATLATTTTTAQQSVHSSQAAARPCLAPTFVHRSQAFLSCWPFDCSCSTSRSSSS
ncbi:unnamed protein product, partial [Ectocarpus sp. 13 AM-2016]